MTRCVAIVILALTLNAAPLHAQESVFTVTVQSADVHKGPTTGSPVVGHAAFGTALTVSRNLGSWAEIVWSDAPDRKGYVHMTMGRLGAPATKAPVSSTQARTIAAPAPASTYTAAPAMSTAAQRTPGSTGDRVPPPSVPQGGSRISHVLGVGGMVGTMSSFGASGRWWHDKHLGVQAALTHDSMTSDTAAGRVTSMQIEPGVVYALFDRVPDYFWVRPYVGSALSFRHQTWKDTAPSEPVSDSGVGYRVFGGGEFTLASLTQLGLSAELGYRRLPTPFAGFEADRWTVSIAGHWYIK